MESKTDIARNCLRFDIVKKDNINMLQIYKVTYNGFNPNDRPKSLVLSIPASGVDVSSLIKNINQSLPTFKLKDESLKEKILKIMKNIS